MREREREQSVFEKKQSNMVGLPTENIGPFQIYLSFEKKAISSKGYSKWGSVMSKHIYLSLPLILSQLFAESFTEQTLIDLLGEIKPETSNIHTVMLK